MDEQQTSIDNMSDTLMEALQRNLQDNNLQKVTSNYSEFVVDGVDPEDNNYKFLFIPNFTLTSVVNDEDNDGWFLNSEEDAQ